MSSPILALTDWIASSPYRIAPEKEAQLAPFLKNTRTVLTITPGPGFTAEVDVTTTTPHQLSLSVPALELLWTAAHAYVVIFDEYRKALEEHKEFLDVGALARTREAFTLYDWALRNCEDKSCYEWPNPVLRPRKDVPPLSDIQVANEVFLTAVAWIILHEVGHLHLGHSRITVRSRSEEQEADQL